MKLKTLLKVLDKGCKVDVYTSYGALVYKPYHGFDGNETVKKVYAENDTIHIEIEDGRN